MSKPKGLFGADLVLVNGVCLTQSPAHPRAEALALKGERILAVGSTAEMQELCGPQTQVIDLAGRTVVPGLVDVHVHLASDAARSHDVVECRDFYEDVSSIGEIQRRIRERAVQTPPGEWIVARGSPMQDFRLAERRFPTKEDLDKATTEHPVYISFGAHIVVANSLALQRCGVTKDTPSPQGGTVVKDPTTGEPTGVLRERAQYLVTQREMGVGPEALAESILLELEKTVGRGVTTIHDILVAKEELQAYQLLERQGRLPVRVHPLIRVIESGFSKESLLDLGLVQGFGSDWLRLGGIKLSIDGGFTGKNAAFSEPLAWEGEKNPGLIRIQQDELDDTVWRYHEMGMRICTHAIGDVAMDMILEAYEKALHRLPRQDHRHRVEHFGNWMMTPERVARARQMGLVLVPNPSMLYFVGDEALKTLGPKRAEHIFPFRTLLDRGFPLAFGSDAPGYWPVDPLRDLGAAVARQTYAGLVLSPEEKISVAEGFRAQTATAAYVGFQETRLGILEPGKLADVAVLAEDPFRFPPERFRELPFDLTIAGGRVVYQRQTIGAKGR